MPGIGETPTLACMDLPEPQQQDGEELVFLRVDAFNFSAERQSSCSSDDEDDEWRCRDELRPPPPPPTPCESRMALLPPPAAQGFFRWLADRFSTRA
mmetsp:Transcript_3738/g.9536  ORF Transcript_3738/g.9536 Transcript_3738/m.9536 type:complete len:97 (+) Transcript_3738:68-358(+)